MRGFGSVGRFFVAALLVVIGLVAGTSEGLAAVQPEDILLGGIRPRMTYQEIIDRYGPPTREERGYAQLVHRVIYYGDSVEIGFTGRNADGKALYVTVTGDNGWRTPTGIYVGMQLEEAIEICGHDYRMITPPPRRPADSRNSPFYDMRWDGVKYEYRCVPEGVYSYAPGDISFALALTTGNRGPKRVEAITVRAYIPEY